ncbi:MAG TPA: molecular chaperone DnaK [Verrucomicrobiota bacterium]|nr:molecular chaperone DnaK [Verrucomicrobiales bacterium]HRI14013.1 molecular chaperone DnaK [Verrucomicrobiota bacterium]
MGKIVGIDLGTTNSLVAVVDSGIPYVIADAQGQRLTPSVVHIPGPNAAPLVGHPANRIRVLKPRETVYSSKRFIGRRGSEVAREEMLLTYPVAGTGAGPVTFGLHGRAWTPEEIAAEVLKKLKHDAETALGESVTRAVITVPAYFNDAQRNATIKAGELAGLTVERIVNEPTAAALAYGLDKLKDRAKIAVYDLGGGTFDLSILELNQGVFQVLSTHGDTRLGGDDLDKRVTDYLVEKIRSDGPDPAGDFALLSRIREAAESAKIRLSTETEVEIALPFLQGDFSFRCSFTRPELEQLTRDLIERTRAHCLRALADAKLASRDLDQVILVGGQTRMPLVRQLVAQWFGCAEFTEQRGDVRVGDEFHHQSGPELNTGVNPDEAVALGAAIQGEILSGGFRNLLLLDVTPLSLGIETFGGLMNVIIPRNTTIPVKAGEMFTTAVDRQRSMLIHVLQGERERAADNWSLGRFELEFEPAPKAVPRVGVQFEIDANGVLHVLARDVKTGHEKLVQLKSAVDVSDADVNRMIEESVANAFDDLRARQWIEAKLKAGNNLIATRRTMADYDAELDPEYRQQLHQALEDVESVLARENPKTKTGDPALLKAADARLDEVSRPLAEHAMDRVMEAMLKKRGLLKEQPTTESPRT